MNKTVHVLGTDFNGIRGYYKPTKDLEGAGMASEMESWIKELSNPTISEERYNEIC